MSFLKQLEEKKNALKRAETSRQEKAAPEEMIMKDEGDLVNCPTRQSLLLSIGSLH